MSPEEQGFLRDLFRALEDRPLNPDDPAYIGLYDDPTLGLEDPVELLARSISWARTNTSAQLLSGFRGAGKSTELRRLRRDLTNAGYLVLLFDVFEYLSPSSPIDVSDFVMVLAGALSDQLDEAAVLSHAAGHENYWTRLKSFLQTRVEFDEVVGKLGAVDIKASLRTDPTFRQRLHERAAGHLADLVKDMREYVTETVTAIPEERLGQGLVLIVDSLERVSGTISNSEDVQTSLERLFTSHAENMHLPQVHVVYTVPPWLKIRAPGISSQFSGGLQMLHPLKVRAPDAGREPVQASLDALCCVVGARGDWRRLLGEREVLDRLALESGGHLRDLLRMLAEIVRRADRLPVTELTVQRAIGQVRSELLPIALDDVRWLQRIADTHDASLDDISRLPRLVTFLDSHLVLCYRNGEEWYDVHPLVREEVARLAAAHAASAPAAGAAFMPTADEASDL
jgi:hypothetical protein